MFYRKPPNDLDLNVVRSSKERKNMKNVLPEAGAINLFMVVIYVL